MRKLIITLFFVSFIPFIYSDCGVKFNFPGLEGVRAALYDPFNFRSVGSKVGDDSLLFEGIKRPEKGLLYGLITYKDIFKPIPDIPCDDGVLYVIEDIVGTLQVNFPGVSPDYVRVYTDDDFGSEILKEEKNPCDKSDFKLLKGFPYKVNIKQGAQEVTEHISVFRNVTVLDGLVCNIVIKKEKEEIKRISAMTTDTEKIVFEKEPDGSEKYVEIRVLKSTYIVEVATSTRIEKVITNCTNTSTEIPVPGEPCNVTLDFGPLTVDNVTVFSSLTNEIIFEDFSISNNLTLDLVDNEDYYAIIFHNGCPLNISFNCSTPIVNATTSLTILQFQYDTNRIEIICKETDSVVAEYDDDCPKSTFYLLKGEYIVRIHKPEKPKDFLVDLTGDGPYIYVFSRGYFFPYEQEEYQLF